MGERDTPATVDVAVTLRRVLWEHAEPRGGVSQGSREVLGPRPITLPEQFQQTLDRIERAYIAAAMDCARQDRAKAARLLGVDREALDEKLRRWWT